MAQRVAILGGGLGGLTTAFNLTAPEQQGRYEVTVYQLGWRLGGKCATGRNADIADRIQEHGLHVFMGQYQNAFAMVQALYREAADPPFPDWRQGFTQQPAMSLMEQVDGQWVPWVIEAPVFPGTPGIDPPPSLWTRILQILRWILDQTRQVHAAAFQAAAAHPEPWWRRLPAIALADARAAAHAVEAGALAAAIDLVEALESGATAHRADSHAKLAGHLHSARDWLGGGVGASIAVDTELRRFWIIAELGLSTLIGGLRDGLFLDAAANLERVNALDYKSWLKSHGASTAAVESALVRSLYDLIFAYPEGDWQGEGNVEAGTMFVSLMNTACYQGSIIWQFNTATGDLVMTPMYEVLAARGVRFEFFSRVDALVPAADGGSIASVRIGRQVALKSGSYSPLRTLPSGQRVWPDRPLDDQIVDGGALKAADVDLESRWTPWPDAAPSLTLAAGRDYDLLVLAIPPAAHPTICGALMAQKPAWDAMVHAVWTTATQSFQTWLTADQAKLGWTYPAMVGGYDQTALDSWADISPVLATESWPATSGVVSEQIACGPLPCPPFPPPVGELGYPAAMKGAVDVTAQGYLNKDAGTFWKSFNGGPPRGVVASTYSRANIDPSERYTLSVAGSTKFRMTAGGSSYDNLYLTGDWIRNGQNLGSFESTTTSGLLTSHAISGWPATVPSVDAATLALTGAGRATVGPPRYVEHPGDATFPGTISLKDTTMWAFLLEADGAKLDAFCRKMFDAPSNGAVQVRSLASMVMMTIVDIGRGTFDDAPRMGWSAERELTFWIPAARVREDGGKTLATDFDFVMPYLILDNPVAIASGREIFGYLKQQGRIAVPDAGTNAGRLTVDLFATKTFGAETEERMQRLLTLDPVGERPMAAIGSFADGVRALHAHLAASPAWEPTLAFDVELLSDLLQNRVPQLFLKQFRDVADGRNACYQAITEALGQVTRFDAAPSLVEFDMVLEALDSSPVAADLGLASRQRILGAKLTYDMVISPGAVLWRAAT